MKIDLKTALCIAGGFLAIMVPYTIQEPPKGGDSMGAWFFARMIWEQGEFPIAGRSPFFALLCSIFWPLGYPVGPAVMRFFDGLFIFSGLFVLFRCYLKTGTSAFAALIWLPGLLALEGIVKGHAVAALCWAMALRHGRPTPASYAYSYAFLVLSTLLRLNYAVLIVFFVLYDGVRLIRSRKKITSLRNLVPPWQALLSVLLLGAAVVFSTMKSDHRWNNAYYADNVWLGGSDSSLGSAAQLGSFAHWIITSKYAGNFDDHDIYFVAKDDFPDMKSTMDMFKYPEALFGRIYSNKQFISIVTRITDFGEWQFQAAKRAGSHIYAYPVFYGLLFAGLYGFYRRFIHENARRAFFELTAAVIVLTGPLLLVWPSSFYFYHFAPFLVFASAGLGYSLVSLFKARGGSARGLQVIAICMPIVLFSGFYGRMSEVFADAGTWAAWQRPNLVKEKLEGAFETFEELTADCNGVMMSSDYLTVAAFSKKPVERYYTIFEIPPFGQYGGSDYNGLVPDRIDCVYVDKKHVKRNMRTFTTKWSRYEHYLVPYIEHLDALGAKTYILGETGDLTLTVLPKPR